MGSDRYFWVVTGCVWYVKRVYQVIAGLAGGFRVKNHVGTLAHQKGEGADLLGLRVRVRVRVGVKGKG